MHVDHELTFLIYSIDYSDCRILKLKPVQEGKALQGHVIKRLMVKRSRESSCLAHHFRKENCMSYNISPKLADEGHRSPKLGNSDHVLHPGDPVDRDGFTNQPR